MAHLLKAAAVVGDIGIDGHRGHRGPLVHHHDDGADVKEEKSDAREGEPPDGSRLGRHSANRWRSTSKHPRTMKRMWRKGGGARVKGAAAPCCVNAAVRMRYTGILECSTLISV